MSHRIDWSRRHERRVHRRRVVRNVLLIVLVVVLVVIGLGAWRYASEKTPRLSVKAVLPATVRVAGPSPTVAWPKQGTAAVEVEGIGDLGSSGGTTPQPIASLAKIMTAYLILRAYPMSTTSSGFTTTITSNDFATYNSDYQQGESVVTVRVGERLTERQALEALLIPSGNNIATLLANYAAGSEAAFVTRMNTMAHKLGMDHTTYADASGFSPSTVSTASDQLELATAAMKLPSFAQIVAMPSAVLPVEGKVVNYNTLAGQDGFLGIKTGSDSHAGGCFVFAKRATARGKTVTVVGAVLGQDKGASIYPMIDAALQAAQALANSAVAAVHDETILPKGTVVAAVTNADGKHVTAVTSQPITGLGWGGLQARVSVSLARMGTTLARGRQVATVTVAHAATGDLDRGSAVARASARMPALSWHWRLRHVLPKALL